ncbi:MAG: site-2 protease family protein [bacterium]|nr:site-2 protease family protein [bacterium]
MQVDFIFQIAVLIMSVVIHEVSHGYAASMLGDQTARYEGRLTLNPLKHLDPFGSVILPTISYFLGGFIFGWAKPVPYNPHNLRPGRWSEALVAAAGPASNIAIAVIFAVLLRFTSASGGVNGAFMAITASIIFINILLAIFNLMPIPPLDGSKLLFAILPQRYYKLRYTFERYGLVLVIIFIFFAWQFISPIIFYLFRLLTGLTI